METEENGDVITVTSVIMYCLRITSIMQGEYYLFFNCTTSYDDREQDFKL